MTTSRNLFLSKFLKKPSSIGSITPSSHYLTEELLKTLPWEELDSIVELGAGTGAFTHYIAKHKKPTASYLIIEQDADLRALLEKKYPKFSYGNYAEKIEWYMQTQNIRKADCIISGLPFANFTPETRREITAAIKSALIPGGHFLAFQYSLQMYALLKKNFNQMHWSFVLRNFPCAFIYHCRK